MSTVPRTIIEAHEALQSGRMSCVDLIQSHLDRIDEVDSRVHAVLTRLDERALAAAHAVDAKRSSGETLGKLEGIPFTAKDLFLIDGVRTTAASKILDDFIAPYTATAIQKLEAAGAICIAKVNQDEFAHGGSTEYSGYGPTLNPRDLRHVPGGSSGGSAAAVAAGIGLFSLGTDTGGSIRQPASYSGVVGLKPTYGLVSRYGVISMASSFDTIGPLANSVEDAGIVLAAMAGQDSHDATTINLDGLEIPAPAAPKRAAVIKEYMEGLDAEVATVYRQAFERLTSDGWQVDEVSLPNIGLALPCYYVLTPSEISSNLERYDGVRYGSSIHAAATTLEEGYTATRGQFFGPEVQRRILTGTYALSAGYYDAYYKKAMQVRTLIIRDFERAFEEYDVLIGPTAPAPAFKLGENSSVAVSMYLVDIMTVSANLAGIPAISIPLAGPGHLPLGLQLMATQKSDAALLSAAHAAEAALDTELVEVAL